MKYTWHFKLECVENYKNGITTLVPEHLKITQRNFNKKVRTRVRIFDKDGDRNNMMFWKEICQGCFQHKKHDFSFDKLNNKPSNLPEQD